MPAGTRHVLFAQLRSVLLEVTGSLNILLPLYAIVCYDDRNILSCE